MSRDSQYSPFCCASLGTEVLGKKGSIHLDTDEDTDKVDKDEDIDEGEEELSDSFVDNCELEAFVESKLTTKN